MAKVYGLRTQSLVTLPPNPVGPTVEKGQIRILREQYTVVAATALNDELVIGLLPAGSVYVGGHVILSATLGIGAVLDVGSRDWADNTANDDDDRFAAALDGTSTAVLDFLTDLPGGYAYSPTNDQEVYLSFEGADPAAAVVVNVELRYVDNT